MTTFDLPRPPAWMDEGICTQVDPDLWFPEKDGDNGHTAKRICGGCPVRRQCAAYAVDADEVIEGIWGGTTKRQREKLRAGRPTVHERNRAEVARRDGVGEDAGTIAAALDLSVKRVQVILRESRVD